MSKRSYPAVAAIASLIIPGAGQVLERKIQRGILIFLALGTLTGLFFWRLTELAHREIGWTAKFLKVADRRPFFVVLILGGILLAWILNVLDARVLARRRGSLIEGRGIPWLFAVILALFFSVGWQISEIDPGRLVREASEAWTPLSKVLWPWEAAVERITEDVEAGTNVLVDSEGDPPPPAEEVPGQPYIDVVPRSGTLSSLDENNEIIPGSMITITGRGFTPEGEVQIWWADPLGNEFRPRFEGKYVTTRADEAGEFSIRMVMPYRLIPPSAQGQIIHYVMARQIFETGETVASEPLRLTISLIIETIFMGMMATFFGIILAIPVSFLAAKNLMSGSRISLAVYYLARTVMNIVRSIEPLIWALIAVVWVGLGPFAGIVALTIHSVAALGKLYSEAIENIDPGPIEAIQATGATKLQVIAYAVIPQMIPPFVSFTIYRWDINVRMSTVIGMVGGGGIGFLLMQYIRLLDYKAAGIAVWFIALTVAVLDYVSSRIRERFI